MSSYCRQTFFPEMQTQSLTVDHCSKKKNHDCLKTSGVKQGLYCIQPELLYLVVLPVCWCVYLSPA